MPDAPRPIFSPTTCPPPGAVRTAPVLPLYTWEQAGAWFSQGQDRTSAQRCWKCRAALPESDHPQTWVHHDPTGLGRTQAYSCNAATAELYDTIYRRYLKR